MPELAGLNSPSVSLESESLSPGEEWGEDRLLRWLQYQDLLENHLWICFPKQVVSPDRCIPPAFSPLSPAAFCEPCQETKTFTFLCVYSS